MLKHTDGVGIVKTGVAVVARGQLEGAVSSSGMSTRCAAEARPPTLFMDLTRGFVGSCYVGCKVAAGKKLIESFVQDGVMSPISSEWAWPGILVPKPKGGWRFVVDLQELNKLIPHDTYEPPACDACLDWLAGRPYRTTLDLLHGFYGVLLSPETREIFTVVTPFGTYCYSRLVMGYINATAEFQRHTNATFGELLWDSALAMVDDVIIASAEVVPQHRGDVRAAFDRLARRHHAVKPVKANILNDDIE